MHHPNIGFLDLPNDVLFIILKKLDNMDVLYSLFLIGNQRLNMIIQDNIFTGTLDFTLTTPANDILSISDPMLDRFCTDILPTIDYNVKSLIVEAGCLERVLLSAEYPHLTELKIFNFDDEIVWNYFTEQSLFRRVFRQQITDLIIVYRYDLVISTDMRFFKELHQYILNFFENLEYLSIAGAPSVLSLHDLPLTTFSSSTLLKLCVWVNRFEDCLALLDGRLKHLTTLTVLMSYAKDPSATYTKIDLPAMTCFSLTCVCSHDVYVTQILPLLHRMGNLAELTLNITIEDQITFLYGTRINDDILVHMSRLQKFNFYFCIKNELSDAVQNFSIEDVQRTFTEIGYENVRCIAGRIDAEVEWHMFSIPFAFDYLQFLGDTFPDIVFIRVIDLGVYHRIPFKHEFFVRISRCFPSLKKLTVFNSKPQSPISVPSNSDHPVIEYPYLVSLSLQHAHIDYIEQFLNGTKTSLPELKKLTLDYDPLLIVTENFTRETTRLNCTKVRHLGVDKMLVHSQDFYAYFPLFSSCSRHDKFF